MNALGVSASSFMCSSPGPNGVCQGSTQATQRVFLELQTEINRVGRTYGVTKIATDGKIGPKTVAALVTVATRLGDKLGTTNLDSALDGLLFEVEGSPTTPHEIALNAEAITAALQRDGAAESQWSVLTAIQNAAAAAAAGFAPAATPTTPTAPTAPAATGGDWVSAYGADGHRLPAPIDPYTAPPPPAYTAAPGWPTWLKIALGVGAAAGVGGLTAALVSRRSRRGARVAGVGCACRR